MNKIIDFYLRENYLSNSEENRYMAHVMKKRTVEQAELVDIMVGKNTTVTRQDMLVVLDLLKETVMEQILSGYPVKTDFFKANVSIRGGFLNNYDGFEKTRHSVCVNLNSNSDFKKELAFRANVEKQNPPVVGPQINSIFDYEIDDMGTELSPGGMIALRGENFSDEEKETTVFLTREGENEKIPMGKINRVKNRTIICHLPDDLAVGNYRITVSLEGATGITQDSYDDFITIS